MEKGKHHQVILSPIITEKSTAARSVSNTVCFQVPCWASKPEIAQAVQALFQVKVKRVNTQRRPGKFRGRIRTPGRTADSKRAYVTLPEGESIKLLEGLF